MMQIDKLILSDLLLKTPVPPPESGGILGGHAGVITRYFADEGSSHMPAHYRPCVDKLNCIIEQWKSEDVEFYGIYHSHYKGDRFLSLRDVQYIEKIMRSLPKAFDTLYFPIVLPQQEIIAYRADRMDKEICIVCEEIEIK